MRRAGDPAFMPQEIVQGMDGKDVSRPEQAEVRAASPGALRIRFPAGKTASVDLRNTDVFAAANALLFVVMCVDVYYGRYTEHRIVANVYEFAFYALVILAAIAAGWRYLRTVAFPTWVLVLVQAGILAHFAGGFVAVHGGRLYDADVLGLPFDKYVHALNAFAGAALVSRLIEPPRAHPRLHALLVLLVVQGGGAVVEMAEYLAKLNVPGAGVGDYDNNMQDLVANCVGAALYLAASAIVGGSRCARRRSNAPARQESASSAPLA